MRPPWPYRLPASGGGDAVMRVRRGIVTRLLHVEGQPVVVRAWQRRDGTVVFRSRSWRRVSERSEVAIERMRFALGVDDDYRPVYERVSGRSAARDGDPADFAGTGRGAAPGPGRRSPGRSPSS